MKTVYPFPEAPITVVEIQGYLARHPLDCTKDSREIKDQLEEHFGWQVRIATMVLAILWSGYAILPVDNGNRFRFCKFGK